MDNLRRALGRRVRELRTGLKISQEQLAERSDLHWTHISGIERGQYNISLSTLTRLAKGFGIPLSELFADVSEARLRANPRHADKARRRRLPAARPRGAEAMPASVTATGGSRGPALRIVLPRRADRYVTCVPLVSLKAAAGAFSDPQHVEDDKWEWVEITSKRRLRPGMFVAQVVGTSMEPAIPDGAFCLFAAPVVGTRRGKTVLVQLRDTADSETGERYTVKRYESEKIHVDGSWRHSRITLRPNNPKFSPIELNDPDGDQLQVIAECLEVLPDQPA
ncbi:MAG: LexA family transcriptional regulator [Acidobacteria bacterium]|nr:LexA family transcriptional regulator [Acidobacteriota bacterium]